MIHRIRATGRTFRPRALAGAVLALSFVVANVAASQHSHGGTAESTTACAVCASAHHAAITPADGSVASFAQRPVEVLRYTSPKSVQRTLIVTADQTRAPPVSLQELTT